MNNGSLEKQAKYLKAWKVVIFSIIIILTIAIIAGITIYKYEHTFTISKWNENIKDRYKIVSNMLEKHDIIGMSELDIIELLGEEDSKQSSFKISREVFSPEETLVYYLGVDLIDDNWLIISIENGVAVSYCIDVT